MGCGALRLASKARIPQTFLLAARACSPGVRARSVASRVLAVHHWESTPRACDSAGDAWAVHACNCELEAPERQAKPGLPPKRAGNPDKE